MTNSTLNNLVEKIIANVKPDKCLLSTLKDTYFNGGRKIIVSIGKAAWLMADTAYQYFKGQAEGIVITKYGHSKGKIGNLEIYEAGHPLVDENSLKATSRAIELVSNLTKEDNVIFLVSGGGSALFELPEISLEKLQEVNQKLLLNGANIEEINTIRKRLSRVKGGKFAKICQPATVFGFILSDVVGNRLDMIASGPSANDSSTYLEAKELNEKYQLNVAQYFVEPEHNLTNVYNQIIGSSKLLAQSAKQELQALGFECIMANDQVNCDFETIRNQVLQWLQKYSGCEKSTAIIFTGEFTMKVTGSGKGGRCQHLVLSLTQELKKYPGCTVLAFGSDGTDGPTQAAGGFMDGKTNLDVQAYLENFNSYEGLKVMDKLMITGPTNTNVNDAILVLLKR